MLGALVGGALSFFGGRSQRKQSQRQWEINRQDNLPSGIRANAEAAGFNPLVFAGPGVGNGAGYQPTMGHELSTAGQIVTDASLALENQKIRRAELELENKRLEELVKANTLRPTTPGVYGGRNAQGTYLGSGTSNSVRGGDDSNLVVAGVDVRKSDYFSDAEQVEQRYGDVASSVYGGAVIAADGYQTARKSPFGKWWSDQRSTALGNVETRNKIVSEHDERERRKRRRGDQYLSDPSYIPYPTFPPNRPGYPR